MSRVNFKSMKIQNFSIIKDALIPLTNMGMCLIEGRKLYVDDETLHEDSNKDRSNGVGKTSIVEAFYFGLTGEFFDSSTTMASVVNRFEKGSAEITIHGEKDLIPFTIHRTIDVKRKTVDSKATHKVSFIVGQTEIQNEVSSTTQIQEKINQFLGTTPTLILNSRIFGQGEISSFTSVNDRQKKMLLDNLVGLGIFEKLLKTTKSLYSESSSASISLSVEIGNITSTLDKLEKEIQSITTKNQEWISVCEEETIKLKEQIDNMTGELSKDEEFLQLYKNSLSENTYSEEEKLTIEKEIRELGPCYTLISNTLKDIKKQIRTKEVDIQAIQLIAEKEVNKIKSLRELLLSNEKATCPTCSQTITNSHMNMIELEFNSNAQEYLQKISHIQEELAPLQSNKTIAEQILSLLDQFSSSLKKKLLDTEKQREQKDTLEGLIARFSTGIEKRRSEIDTLINTLKNKTIDIKSPYDEMLEEKTKELVTLKNTLENKQYIYDQLEIDKSYYNLLIRAFDKDGIPRLISIDALKVINQLVTKYTSKLLGPGFHIELKMKERGKSDEIYPDIVNPNGGLTYYRQSKGEKKAIDLCQQLAFSKFAEMQNRVNFNVKFIDEVFAELDPYTSELVLELLRDEPIESKFIITHKDLCKEEFQNRILVTKTGKYSTVKVQKAEMET